MTARIAVVGSALTRTALAQDPRLSVPAGHFLARVSLAGLGTPPVQDADLDGVSSEFRRELVRRDLSRGLVDDLVRLDPDLIVVDFADERFALDVLETGAVVTVSPEYLESAPPADGRRRVTGGSSEHLRLWTAGWETFLADLEAAGLAERVMLHHGGMTVRGDEGAVARNEDWIAAAARFSDRLGDHAARDLGPLRVVRVDDAIRHAAVDDDGAVDPLGLAPAASLALADGVVAVLAGRDPREVEGVMEVVPAEARVGVAPTGGLEPRPLVASDYTNYGVAPVAWRTPEGFTSSAFDAGLHVLPLPDGNHLDIIIRGDLRTVAEGQSIVVFLTGAMSQRNGMAPPFFAGRRLSHELGVPWVAVSDPSMQLADDLLLAWYTGSPGSRAHETLLSALRAMADGLDRDLLLVGGSGGGFAALRLNEDLEGRASVFAWNPQTDLLDYHPPAVEHYLRVLFPGEGLGPEGDRDVAAARLADEGLGHRVGTLTAGRRVLVYQNAGDHHVEGHLIPLLRRSSGMRGGPRRFDAGEQHQVRIASWGRGHAALPSHITARAVDAMRRGHSARVVAADIDALLARGAEGRAGWPDVLVTGEPGGLARVDWALPSDGPAQAASWTLSRMRGGGVVDRVERIRPPVVLPGLRGGEHWRLESFDDRGRRLHDMHLDGRGEAVGPEPPRRAVRPRHAQQ